MKEVKVIALEGKTLSDYADEINKKTRGGWKLVGTFGKNNMLFIFQREIKVTEEDEE